MNRALAKTILAAAVLVPSVLLAQTKIDVSSRLIDYDLKQAVGESSTDTALPRITVASGSEKTVELTREYKYPKKFNRILGLNVASSGTAYLGIRFPIYVRDNNNGTVSFLLRVELCERVDPSDPVSPVVKTTTSYWGERAFDKSFSIEVRAPQHRTARLELLLTRH